MLSGIAYIALTTMMTRQSPAGAGTTMVRNGSVINLGAAVGAAVGGFLIALGGYALLGLLVPAFVLAGSALVLPVRPSDAADAVGGEFRIVPE